MLREKMNEHIIDMHDTTSVSNPKYVHTCLKSNSLTGL